MSRYDIVHQTFRDRVAAGDLPDAKASDTGLSPTDAVRVFRAQALSRALDLTSVEMQARREGFYTIGSSGHEGMAAVAHALRVTDMAFLHYRDAAFQIARAMQADQPTIAWDMLLSFACSSEDPTSGGRHKVLGSKAMNIPPQTSTIGSHLPKAVGAAYSIGTLRRIQPEHAQLAPDSLVMASFGDGSLNHSTVQGAVNTASWTAFQSMPLPLMMVCEDNGIGISTRTPAGWVETSIKARPGLHYFSANGLDIFETTRVTAEAAAYIRQTKRPAFLHLKTVRVFGHAGSDARQGYMSQAEIDAAEADDPLLHTVALLRASGALDPVQALEIYDETCARVQASATEIAKRPHLKDAQAVMRSIVPPKRQNTPTNGPSAEARKAAFGSDLKAMQEPQHMARLINWALTDLMLVHPETVMMGEDVGRKGGVYGVTQKLFQRFGRHRVIDTLLDEQSILGLAIGMAHNGFVPIPEIQFLAYLHNAEDQLRGEAAALPFFSDGQYTNPMVVRIAGLGYQKGFGGHFHNDNSLAVLRDIPGLIVACPSRGDDAALILREAVRLAREDQRVVVIIEPIALYPERDLHAEGDKGWTALYPPPDERAPLGEVGVNGDGDLAIVTYGNGVRMAHQASAQMPHATRVIDLRWLSPLPGPSLLAALEGCKRVLIVDECRETGNISEEIMTLLAEHTTLPAARVTATNSFIATGPAYAATLPSVAGIVTAANALMERRT